MIPTDLRRDEVERRRNLMLELLAETPARLSLVRFRPSETLRVRLRLADLDAIAFVPIGADVEMCEIVRPTTARAVENLVAEIAGFRWLITWQEGELRVRLHRILTTVGTMVTYRNGEATGFIGRGRQLPPREAARIATLARDYLEAALQHCDNRWTASCPLRHQVPRSLRDCISSPSRANPGDVRADSLLRGSFEHPLPSPTSRLSQFLGDGRNRLVGSLHHARAAQRLKEAFCPQRNLTAP